MGHSQFDDASRERAAWNAGKLVGTRRPLPRNRYGQFGFSSTAKDAFVTARFSIWPSTASEQARMAALTRRLCCLPVGLGVVSCPTASGRPSRESGRSAGYCTSTATRPPTLVVQIFPARS